MYSQVATITHRATNKGPLNILCMDTHERYQTNLAQTGHNFYSFYVEGQKVWNPVYGETPDNYHRILNPSGRNQLQNAVIFDLILSQNKFGQFQVLSEVAKQIGVPIINVEHTLPYKTWSQRKLEQAKSMKGDYNVYLSEFSRREWNGEGTIIHNAVDVDIFCPADVHKIPHVLSIVNEWKTRDYFCGYNLWCDVTHDIPTHVRGDNAGWTTPTDTLEELVNEYRQATVFLNTSLYSTCPTTVLEAAACGLPIVTTATTMLPDIIENGYNGFITNKPEELNMYVKRLLNNPELAYELGQNARKTMIERFSMDSFVQKWNNLFESTRDFVYTGKF